MPEVRLIDREQAWKNICKYCASNAYCKEDDCMVYQGLRDTPTIQTEAEPVRHGRWIPTEYDSYADGVPVWDKWECSECGHEHSGEEDTLTAFCPDCGAKMDGGADNG
jgi:DNA-directed RNA polymerase subunit RPC12/RpoP